MMTTKQAAGVWCPMRQGARPDPASFFADQSAGCVAGQCAMWRWLDAAPEMPDPEEWSPDPDDDEKARDDIGNLPQDAVFAKPVYVPASAEWVPPGPPCEKGWQVGGYWVESEESVQARQSAAMAMRTGYCGLAGKPVIA